MISALTTQWPPKTHTDIFFACGKKSDEQVLAAHIKRLLADPRSRRFSQNFVEQWLGLEKMNSVTHAAADYLLQGVVLEEPFAFFEEVLNHNFSVMDFIHSDYAVVNDRLAAHWKGFLQTVQIFSGRWGFL